MTAARTGISFAGFCNVYCCLSVELSLKGLLYNGWFARLHGDRTKLFADDSKAMLAS